MELECNLSSFKPNASDSSVFYETAIHFKARLVIFGHKIFVYFLLLLVTCICSFSVADDGENAEDETNSSRCEFPDTELKIVTTGQGRLEFVALDVNDAPDPSGTVSDQNRFTH